MKKMLLSLLLIIGLASSLTGCVVYEVDDDDDDYEYSDRDDDDYGDND